MHAAGTLWRGNAKFGEGRRVAHNHQSRALWRVRVSVARAKGKLTASFVDVAMALLKRLGENGRLDPSHATIAKDALVSERTVRRALAALKGLKLLSWEPRLRKDPLSWRTEQNSNAYVLETEGSGAPEISAASGGQTGRATKIPMFTKEKPQGSTVPPADAWDAREALRKMREVREALLRAQWAGRKRI